MLKKVTMPYLQDKVKFKTVIVLVDISIPPHVDWKNKKVLKRKRRGSSLKNEMSTLHFLQLYSLKQDQTLRSPKATTFQPHILLFPISNPFPLSFLVSYFINDSKVKPSTTHRLHWPGMLWSPREQGVCFCF